MANCLLCWPNRIDNATLSGGLWLSALPLSNLKSRFQNNIARSQNLDSSSLVIDVDFGKKRYTTSVALVNHNLSLTSTVRIRLWSDATKTTAVYDSGFVDVWPRCYDTIKLRWCDENFWYGRVPSEQKNTVHSVFLHVISSETFIANATSSQYATINILDNANTDGYVQIGRLFMAEDFTPVTNFVYGATISWNDPSSIDTALDGTEYFELRTKYRKVAFQLKYMDHYEGTNKALLMTLDRGTTKDVLFVFDPSNQKLMQQRSFIGRISTINALEYPMFARNNMSFEIKETI